MHVTITPPDWATHILSDFTDWDRSPAPVSGTVSYELSDDTYFEYAFLDAEGKQRPDPANSTVAENPWFPAARAMMGAAYRPDPYTDTEAVEEGTTERLRLESRHMQGTRRAILYSPKGYEGQALPIVYLQDGVAYYRFAKLHRVLERLIEDGLARPAHLVFLEPGERTSEYGFNRAYRAFVLEEALPAAEEKLAPSGERIAMGASLGGLVSATLAWEHPEVFSTVVTQSGAFLGSPDKKDLYHSTHSWFLEELRSSPPKPLRFYTETGTIEWLADINRKVSAALKEQGYDHAYNERHAGHNWVNWRNGFSPALQFALKP